MNLIDNVVSFFDPGAGLKRVQKRAALDIVKRGYEAARRDKHNAGWKIIDDKLKDIDDGKILRQRSKDLFRNNSYSFRAHKSIKNNTIGTGILPAIKDEKLKERWKDWAEDIHVDFEENLDFYGIQHLCSGVMSIEGNCFVLRIKNTDRKRVPLELKVVTQDFLDRTKDSTKISGGGWIIGGIEYKADGKKKGYWIFDQDPSWNYGKSSFWSKDDVIHLFEIDEPGQILGVPNGTSSMTSSRDLDDYANAQLTKQKIAACFSVFITENSETTSLGNSSSDDRLERVEPGIIEHLQPGKQVSFAAPPSAEGYGEYTRNILTGIAAGHGVTYEAMTNDLSHVNFSSGRIGGMEYGRNIEAWQWFIIIPKLCKVVWKWFIEAGIIAGLIDKDAPMTVEWTAPRRQMIDPVKETNGLLAQVRAGLMSWQEAVRSLGYTPEEIIKEMIAAKKLFDDAGLAPESDPRYDVKTPYNLPPEEETKTKK